MTSRTDRQKTFAADLLRLARTYRRQVDRSLEEHAISDARALPVLFIARSGGGMRQGVLAEELGLEGPSLVRLLDQLCTAGLVERRNDPTDGRAKTLHVTPAGQELAVTVEKVLHGLRTQLLRDVSEEDLAATLRTFAAFQAGIDALDPKTRGS